MLVETKARIGVFAIALGAYLPQFPSLIPEFEQQYRDFKATLPDTVELIDGGLVTTKELSAAGGRPVPRRRCGSGDHAAADLCHLLQYAARRP